MSNDSTDWTTLFSGKTSIKPKETYSEKITRERKENFARRNGDSSNASFNNEINNAVSDANSNQYAKNAQFSAAISNSTKNSAPKYIPGAPDYAQPGWKRTPEAQKSFEAAQNRAKNASQVPPKVGSNGGGSSGGISNVYRPPADSRSEQQKQDQFYKKALEVEEAAANGNPGPMKEFDKFFNITRPEIEYTPEFYKHKNLKLIRGNGALSGDDGELNVGNGSAVYAVNNRGERFHVTAKLAKEMQANGTWKDPEIVSQSTVDGMKFRYDLEKAADINTINSKLSADGMMIVKGGGPEVYAVDENGNKFHITAEKASEMRKDGTWINPTVISQNAVDQLKTGNTYGSTGNGLSTETDAVAVTPVNETEQKPDSATIKDSETEESEPTFSIVPQEFQDQGYEQVSFAVTNSHDAGDSYRAVLKTPQGSNVTVVREFDPESGTDHVYMQGKVYNSLDEAIDAHSGSIESDRSIAGPGAVVAPGAVEGSTGDSGSGDSDGQSESSETGSGSNKSVEEEKPMADNGGQIKESQDKKENALASSSLDKRRSADEKRLEKIVRQRNRWGGASAGAGADSLAAPVVTPAANLPNTGISTR